MNGAGGMNQKRRPIIIKELETRYEKTTAIYNGTMERLRRINGGRPVTDKAAIVMLSQEIEAYRAHIQQLRGMSTKLLTEDIVKSDIFAKNVKRLLDKKCMSQRELADTVGVTEVAMSRYLNDGRMPKGPILYNMAKVLGVSIEYLFEEHPEEKDCKDCEYGPVWNDICRTCISPAPANADPEEKAAGSGAQAEKEAGNIRDQLIRKGDALEILNGILSVPRKTPDESVKAFQKYLQKYADRIKALPAEGTAEPKSKPCPFCGGHATVEKADGEISSAWVECDRCGARTRKHYGPSKEDKALTAWNQRLDPEE